MDSQTPGDGDTDPHAGTGLTGDTGAAAGHPGDSGASGASRGPAQWARRGAEASGLPAGETGAGPEPADPPTTDDREPDVGPSLAGGHADSAAGDAPS